MNNFPEVPTQEMNIIPYQGDSQYVAIEQGVEDRTPFSLRRKIAGAVLSTAASLSTLVVASDVQSAQAQENPQVASSVAEFPFFAESKLGCGPIVVAHRGRMGAAENTIPGIKYGLSKVDAAEFDVRRTKAYYTADGTRIPGELVLMHDATVDRTTHSRGLIREKTYAQVRRIVTNNGSYIPRLMRALREVDEYGVDNRKALVEWKIVPTKSEAEKTIAMFDKFAMRDRVMITSSHLSALATFHTLASDIPLGYIQKTGVWPNLANVPDYVTTLNVHEDVATKSRVSAANTAGFGVLQRTVNNVATANQAIYEGSALINSDKPSAVVEACND